MTRINVVPVTELTDKHLISEYREITRLPGNLNKSLNRKSKPFSMSEIPPAYKLGTGHVRFFYDKMKYLHTRYDQLVSEMLRRGFNPKFREGTVFTQVPSKFYGEYTPTSEAMELNRERIRERLGL